MFCPKCGKKNDDNYRFCKYCSYELPTINEKNEEDTISNNDQNTDDSKKNSNSSNNTNQESRQFFIKNKIALIGTIAGVFITVTTVIINFSQIKDIFAPAPEPQKIMFEESPIFMYEGAITIPIIKTIPENANTKNLTWEIEDPEIAEYSDAKLTAKKTGKTVLNVYLNDFVYTSTDVVIGSEKQFDNALVQSVSSTVNENINVEIGLVPHYIDNFPGKFKGKLYVEIENLDGEKVFSETNDVELPTTGSLFVIELDSITPGSTPYGILYYRLYDDKYYDSELQHEKLYHLPEKDGGLEGLVDNIFNK